VSLAIPQAPGLVIFCRRPQLGIGKRRVAKTLGNDMALKLAEQLLSVTLEDADQWPGPVILSPANPEDENWARALGSADFEVIAQPTGNLGQRINAVDQAARRAGHTHLIYIGSDSPTLDEEYFKAARDALTTYDTVLGPAEDGGVTLMGSREPWPNLATLPWSSAELGTDLELMCMQAGHTVYRLQSRYDIDRSDDLPKLFDDLRDDLRPARRRFRKWLAEEGMMLPSKPNK
jgi:rSAM/selenodomain-associated transferase 1